MTDTRPAPPAPHPAVDTAFLVNQAVLFDERNGQVHELNPSASAVWMLLDGATAVDALVGELHELLGVPVDVLRPDVEAVLAYFARSGLLVGSELVVDPASPDDHHHADHRHDAAAGGVTVLPRPPDP